MGISTGTGLSSGIDYTSMITQLMQIEAQPQDLLKNQLADSQDDAKAYREINTSLASLSSAAQALTGSGVTAARKASSSSTTAAATAGATAVPGSSVSFSVSQLATAQTSLSAGTWASSSDPMQAATSSTGTMPGWPLTVTQGGKSTTIKLDAGASLNDAAAAINKSGAGLSASVIHLDTGYKLQVTGAATGTVGSFKMTSDADPTGSAFTSAAPQDAIIKIGGMPLTSSSNTFNELLTGVSVTVSQVSAATDAATTITVANDTSAVTAKVKAMIDAANTALSTIRRNTDSSQGSPAALKGNWTLTNLASQMLTQVSNAVGGSSPAKAGISLSRDGTIRFDATVFSAALVADPTLTQKIVGGATGAGADNINYTPDDTIDTDGLASRLSSLAERASDSAAGMITNLANSQDARTKDIQKQIDVWNLRLASRKASLTTQFNAMEKALGALQSQSTWLTGQLKSLPSWSSSDS
ncbi:flagellar filament capping protein FliD [Modestobacter altitudinis]|uniref:flagellar filament capping protein FliD n=1 Tax=Modestobacter altitudinis TaxID=2213158 RepID=UPI00110CC870|nr:flagellar filament capping protein FliD [Modestobacter altitudinis]